MQFYDDSWSALTNRAGKGASHLGKIGTVMLQNIRVESLKNRTLSSALAPAQRPTQQAHLHTFLYLLHLHCDSRQKSPTPRFTHCGSPRRPPVPSRLAAVPPSCVKLRHVYRRIVLHHRRAHSASSRRVGGRGRCRCRHRRDARPQLVTSRDPEWPDPERASPAAPCAPFLPQMLQAYV